MADETSIHSIDSAVDGFVRETDEDTIGSPVKKGQRLAVVYSHEFVSAAGGYLSASERTQRGPGKEGEAGTQSLPEIQNWGDRLRNLGMSETQIRELSATRKVPDGVYIVSPQDGFIVARNINPGMRFDRNMEFYRIADLGRVWVVADLFEDEDRYLRPGTVGRITLWNQGRISYARVSDILPQVDPASHAVRLRMEVDNKNLALRPNMLVNVDFTLPAPPGLSVPADAVVDSGLSQRVYVEHGNGMFEPRQVETGERFGDRVQIVGGLSIGEKVVVSGTFLVDSESRLKSPPQGAPRTAVRRMTRGSGPEMTELR
jgi:Cu(I)/Ag(I) efflux system membrane fusion protein